MAETRVKTVAPAYDGSTPVRRNVGGQPRKNAPAYPKPAWREAPPENVAQEIERLAAGHMSKERIAIELGTSGKTFRRWLEDDPVLAECFDRGRAKAEHELYMLIVEDARAGKKLNMPAVFALNNRHNWRMERQEDNGRVNVTINLPSSRPLSEFIEGESEVVRP